MDNPLLLVVEDELLQQLTLEDSLEDAGFTIILASNASQAFSEIEKNAGRLKGLITDIRIGSTKSGRDVARHARENVPLIPVVYITGDSGHEWASQGVPNSLLLTKSYAMAQLITAIPQLMNSAGQAQAVS